MPAEADIGVWARGLVVPGVAFLQPKAAMALVVATSSRGSPAAAKRPHRTPPVFHLTTQHHGIAAAAAIAYGRGAAVD